MAGILVYYQNQFVGMAASILDLAAVISERTSAREQLEWFQGKGLIARTKICPACNAAMELQTRNDISDKYR